MSLDLILILTLKLLSVSQTFISPAFWRSGVPAFRRSGVPAFRRYGVPAFRRSSVPAFRRSGASIFRRSTVLGSSTSLGFLFKNGVILKSHL